MSDELRDITGFLYEIGLLKRYKRTGWSTVGVPAPESIADHSYRVSVIASVIAAMEGADPQRASFLALWHDSQETRTTDLPHLTKRYVSASANEDVTAEQVRPLPTAVAAMIADAVREYEEQGHQNVQPWIDSSIASLQTGSVKALAEEALAQNTLAWLDRAKRPTEDG